MRIVIDGGTWDNARAYGRFTRELVGALGRINHRHDIVLLLPRTVPSVEVPSGERLLDDPGPSRSLGDRALACATALSWADSARAAVDLFEELTS